MVILTVMVAVVVPSLGAFTIGRKTNYAAIQIVALAKFARSQAVNEGRTYRLNFQTSNPPSLWLTVQNVGQFVEPGNSLANRLQLPDGVTMRTDLTAQPPDGTYVDFHSDGRTGDGPVHVWITDRQGRMIEMACLSPTELFHVLPPEETTSQ